MGWLPIVYYEEALNIFISWKYVWELVHASKIASTKLCPSNDCRESNHQVEVSILAWSFKFSHVGFVGLVRNFHIISCKWDNDRPHETNYLLYILLYLLGSRNDCLAHGKSASSIKINHGKQLLLIVSTFFEFLLFLWRELVVSSSVNV